MPQHNDETLILLELLTSTISMMSVQCFKNPDHKHQLEILVSKAVEDRAEAQGIYYSLTNMICHVCGHWTMHRDGRCTICTETTVEEL